ncbi:MAG TPA: DUF4383 domain-containing protein [Actinomycetota bacterium]|nr:DUF4383 domain-containing protein [Actinomycetota bacterium]
MDRTAPRRGYARTFGWIWGIAYLAVALLELLTMNNGLQVGGTEILRFGALHNGIHWATGIALIGSAMAGEGAARLVCRIIGVAFVAVVIWNFISPDSYARFVGMGDDLPVSYILVHIITALGALFAGFAGPATDRDRT